MVGKLRRVPLRKVWAHEEYDFTTWLTDNVDVLNDVLDLNLTSAEREQSAGTFRVDITAEDDLGNTVVIENQLEKSDHDHLGKLVTYLANLEASVAVWIVSEPRPEHINAISWLNESPSGDFYLLKVEAVQIGNSEPAPLITLIIGPSEEGRQIGEKKRELSERHHIRRQFWTELLVIAKNEETRFANISPSNESWISSGAGKYGLSYMFSIRQYDSQVALYIDRGKDSNEENKDIFDQLLANRVSIEEAFGEELVWDRLDDRRASRIRKILPDGGYRDEGDWEKTQQSLVANMIRFERSMNQFITQLKL